MARLQTGDTGTGAQDAPGRTPRGDEHLDDWFARRLEAQGIGAPRRRPLATARLLSLLGLMVAVVALGWVLTSLTSSSHTVATTGSHHRHHPTKTKSKPHKVSIPAWKRIRLTVLNGFGGSGAAATASAQLKAQGFNVIRDGTAATTSTTTTYVAYAPGYQVGAGIIARKLGLATPVPLSQATGVSATQKTGVVVVLGPSLLG